MASTKWGRDKNNIFFFFFCLNGFDLVSERLVLLHKQVLWQRMSLFPTMKFILAGMSTEVASTATVRTTVRPRWPCLSVPSCQIRRKRNLRQSH